MMRNTIESRGLRTETGARARRAAGLTHPSVLIPQSSERGFTLVEMIMVITITGIIGGIVAVFLMAPIQQYADIARRAEMTDIADTALRRITRDLRLALPNSVRVSPDGYYLEFLPTSGGGRYCAAAPCDELDFSSAADGSFEVLGPPVAANSYLVIYNLGIPSASGCASLGADAYEGCNRRTILTGGNTITFTPTALPLPFDSPGHRFHVISTPVTYVCAPAPGGGGTLKRWQGYTIQSVQPTTLPGDAVTPPPLLASNVSSCSFTYTNNVVAERSGLVTMHLGLTRDNETVTLYSAAHVSNRP